MFKDLNTQQKKVAQAAGYHGLFAERETVKEAYDYAMMIVEALPSECKAHVVTAIHVLLNTIAVNRAEGWGDE